MIEDACTTYMESLDNPWNILHRTKITQNEESFLRTHLEGCTDVLDVAGGTGFVSNIAAPKATITVVDSSQKMLDEGKKRYPETTFVHASAYELPFEDASFDAVLMRGSIAYFSDKQKLIREMHRVLRQGGKLLFVERNRYDIINLAVFFRHSFDAFEKPRDFTTVRTVLSLLKKEFSIIERRGLMLTFPSLHRVFFSGSKKDLCSFRLFKHLRIRPSQYVRPYVRRGAFLKKPFDHISRWMLVCAVKK